MSKEKQIEEMALDINRVASFGLEMSANLAEDLYELDYRKASEVFEEIINLMNEVYSSVQYGCYSYGVAKQADSPSALRQMGKLEGIKYLGDAIAELKKKYIGEDINVTTNTED